MGKNSNMDLELLTQIIEMLAEEYEIKEMKEKERAAKKVSEPTVKASQPVVKKEQPKQATVKKETSELSDIEILVDEVLKIVSMALKRAAVKSDVVNSVAVLDANMYQAYLKQGFSKIEALELVLSNKKMMTKLV